MSQKISLEYKRIHRAIHDHRCTSVVIGEQTLPVQTTAVTNLRYVIYDGCTFQQQEPKRNSMYGAQALSGKHITWVQCAQRPWIYIDDQTPVHRPELSLP